MLPIRFPLTLSPLLLLALGMLGAGCRSHPPAPPLTRFKFNEPHMGTLFSITLYATNADSANAAAEAAFRKIGRLDQLMTDYNTNSELMRLPTRPVGESIPVSPEMFEILQESQRVARETDGAFDVTVGPFVRAWRAARKSKVMPSTEQIAQLRNSVGYQKLKLDPNQRTVALLAPGMQLDLGGIAKGYAADQALILMRKFGIRSALVAASGDIAVGDAPPGLPGWQIGIGTMDDSDRVERKVLLKNAAVSTSGDTEQFVEINGIRYSHIVDPITGLGLTNRIQVTVIGPNATITDGLDTPLSIMGIEKALRFVEARKELSAIIVTKDETGLHHRLSHRFKKKFKQVE